MDELKALMGSLDRDRDLIDKLLNFLERQTDHKLSPHLLLGFLGLFNLLSIMNILHRGNGMGIKEVPVSTESANAGQSTVDALSGLLKTQGAGQNDLMSLLGNLAGNKKINPGLLLSLMSMLNNQSGAKAAKEETSSRAPAVNESAAGSGEGIENKAADGKQGVELKYDRKKAPGESV